MPNFQVISKERYASQGWRRFADYRFAASEAVVPLVGVELPKAVLSLPIAFIEQADVFMPVAVLGIEPGSNLYVTPDGRWTQSYIPAIFRGYPFRLANTADGPQVLCFDEDSGLLTGGEGESFFDDEGKPSPSVQAILDFLSQMEQSRRATANACAALVTHELVVPWPITVQAASGAKEIAGLYKIDEARLNMLPAAALMNLRDAGALPLIYCQLLSMQNLQVLGQRAVAYANVPPPPPLPAGDLDLGFLNNGGTISFANLS